MESGEDFNPMRNRANKPPVHDAAQSEGHFFLGMPTSLYDSRFPHQYIPQYPFGLPGYNAPSFEYRIQNQIPLVNGAPFPAYHSPSYGEDGSSNTDIPVPRPYSMWPARSESVEEQRQELKYGPAALEVDLILNGFPHTPMDLAMRIIQDDAGRIIGEMLQRLLLEDVARFGERSRMLDHMCRHVYADRDPRPYEILSAGAISLQEALDGTNMEGDAMYEAQSEESGKKMSAATSWGKADPSAGCTQGMASLKSDQQEVSYGYFAPSSQYTTAYCGPSTSYQDRQ